MTTLVQHTLDPKSGKIITHYGPDSLFTVYIKKYNGRKIVLYMGNGTQINDILNFYNAQAVYTNDKKYLYHRKANEPLNTEEKVLMENGKGQNTLNREDRQVGRKKVPYQHGEISAMGHIPKSLLADLKKFNEKVYTINGTRMNKTRLISILIAEFLEKPELEKIEYLTRMDLLLEKHKLMSGGVNPKRIGAASMYDNNRPEADDLL